MQALISAHSGLRWIALILLLLAIFNAFSAKDYQKKHRLINLFTLITFHTQLLIGLFLYNNFMTTKLAENWTSIPAQRFFGMEHLAGMLLAIIAITIGYSKSKKGQDAQAKFKAIKIWYVLALILVLAFIPWPFRTALGAGWF